jgi:hypothetical protein
VERRRTRTSSVLNAGSARRRAALGVHALLAGSLVPAFVLWHGGRWHQPAVLVVLLLVAIIAEPVEVRLTSGIRLDGTVAVGLIALVLAGPLTAFLVLFVPIVTSATILWRLPGCTVERRPLFRAGNLSNLASYGWAMLAAAGTLTALGVHGTSAPALPAVLLAGVVFEAGQLALGPCIHKTLYNGYQLGEILRVAVVACGADLVMILIGAITLVLIEPLGIGALALSTAVVMLPSAVPAAVRARPAGELPQHDVARVYWDALASVLGLTAEQRRQLPRIMESVHAARAHEREQRERLARAGVASRRGTLDVVFERSFKEALAHTDPTAYAAVAVDECWDGSGPCGLPTRRAPLSARILAVADEWGALTGHGGPELSHEAALWRLALEAGRRFDPAVVDAAAFIVDRERGLSSVPAFQPRAHRLPDLLCRSVVRLGAQLAA